MAEFICTTCGIQYPPSDTPPASCTICQEERQFIGPTGQAWTTLPALRRTHFNSFRRYEPGLMGIGTVPAFAIAQRALLVRTSKANILWDCISFIDDATVEIVGALGGISAIAISHPHFYASMIAWSHAFGNVPVYLHADDRRWVMRPDPVIAFWEGETVALDTGLTLLRCGGHFAGGAVLHWSDGGGGKGALLSGDIATVTPAGKLSFMRSYPNHIPLDAGSVGRIAGVLEAWPFEPIYGGWWDRIIPAAGKAALTHSVQRYIAAISHPPVD
jgi:hypothetical protein